MNSVVPIEQAESKYRFTLIPVDQCVMVWNDVRGLLAPAVERSSGRWTTEHLLAALCTGNQSLWVAYDDEGYIRAAMTTQIVFYPGIKMLAIQFLGGDGFDEWNDGILSLVERYATDCGCKGVEAVARFGFWPFLKRRKYSRSHVTYDLFFEE